MSSENLMTLTSIASVLITIFGAWFAIVKFISPFFKRVKKWMSTWENFMDDWFGEQERPGVPGRQGVMERLHNIELEVKPNGGGSMKDAVNRIETSLRQIDSRLEDGNNRFEKIEKRLDSLEKNL